MKNVLSRWNLPQFFSALLLGASSFFSPLAHAQYLQNYPACSGNSSDSACWVLGSPVCTVTDVSEPRACPAPLSGNGIILGTRDSCTGAITWNTGTFDSTSCTSCTTPLTQTEVIGVQNAILGILEPFNTRFLAYNNSPLPVDGTSITNNYNPGSGALGWPVGRSFRERVWVPDPFTSPSPMPTTFRFNYLASVGLIPQVTPPIPGITGNSTVFLYREAAGNISNYTTCSNSNSACNLDCTPPSGGIFDRFCNDYQVAWKADGCNDNWQVYDTASASWRSTNGVTAPYTAPTNYANADWTWEQVIGWNGNTPNDTDTFPAFLCSSTLRTCTGWQTQTTTQFCAASHTETGVVCDANGVNCSDTTYLVCDLYDYELVQFNDCTGASRTILQSTLPNSCGGVAPVPICPGTMTYSGVTGRCECPANRVFDGTTCVIDYSNIPASLTVWPTNVSTFQRYATTLPNGNPGVVYNNRDPNTGTFLNGASEEYSGVVDVTAGQAVGFWPLANEVKTVTQAGTPVPTRCPAYADSWGVAPDICSGAVPQTAAGGFALVNNTAATGSGSASLTCGATGAWAVSGTPTCSTPGAAPTLCSGTTVSWGAGCSAAVPTAASGSVFVPYGLGTNAAGQQVGGTATVVCSGTTFSVSGSCTPTQERAYSQLALSNSLVAIYGTATDIDYGSRCSSSTGDPSTAYLPRDCPVGSQLNLVSEVSMPAGTTYGASATAAYRFGTSGSYILSRDYYVFTGAPSASTVWRTNDPAYTGTPPPPPPPVVNGACGTANGVGAVVAPSANLCAAGTATAVTSTATTWNWSCNGSGTGATNATCSAPIVTIAPDQFSSSDTGTWIDYRIKLYSSVAGSINCGGLATPANAVTTFFDAGGVADPSTYTTTYTCLGVPQTYTLSLCGGGNSAGGGGPIVNFACN